MRFYELTGAYAELQDAAEQGEDVTEALAQVSDAIEVKAKNIASLLHSLTADVAAIHSEEKRLADRRRSLERNRERLREYLRSNMERMGVEKIRCPHFSLTLSAGPERVDIEDERAVPPEFTRTKVEVDKVSILRAWKEAGECVPGTRIERGTRLLIK